MKQTLKLTTKQLKAIFVVINVYFNEIEKPEFISEELKNVKRIILKKL